MTTAEHVGQEASGSVNPRRITLPAVALMLAR